MFGKAPCDETVIRTATHEASYCPQNAKPWVLAATILGSSMAFIDGSVISVALPAIQADLAAPIRDAQWIVNAYTLLLGALILVGGAVGDSFGRRRIFTIGIVIFTVASLICAIAPNTITLIMARALQGIGGALLVPSTLAIISAAFPEAERGRAIGTWAGASALTTALGPVLGGWMVDELSWRTIFVINAPLAVIVLAITAWHVPESHGGRTDAPVDWLGGVLATLGLGSLTYGMTATSELGWAHPLVILAMSAGVAILAAFLRTEAKSLSPMMPLHLFRSTTFSGANAITLLLYFALSGALFFLPFQLIQLDGYSATEAGAVFLPFTLIMGGLSRWSGGLCERYGARAPLIVGPVIVAVGFTLLAEPDILSHGLTYWLAADWGDSYWATYFPAMIVLGFGMAISVAPLTTAVMGAIEDRYAGTASGINNAVARIAGLLAVALLGALAVGTFGHDLDRRLSAHNIAPEIRQAIEAEVPKLGEASVPPQVPDTLRWTVEDTLRESLSASFRFTLLVTAALALLSAACAAVTIAGKPRRSQTRQPERG